MLVDYNSHSCCWWHVQFVIFGVAAQLMGHYHGSQVAHNVLWVMLELGVYPIG